MSRVKQLLLFIIIFGTTAIGWPFIVASEAYRVGILIISISIFQLISPIALYHFCEHPPIRFFLIFLLILTLLQSIYPDPSLQLIGQPPFFQGLIFIWSLLFLSVIFYRSSLQRISIFFTISAVYIAAIAIVQVFLQHNNIAIPLYTNRVISTLGQPSWFGGYLLILLPLIFSLRRSPRLRFPIWISTLLIITAIIISRSSTAIFLLLLLIVGWILAKLSTPHKIIFIITFLYLANLFYQQPFNHFQGRINRYLDQEIAQPFHPKLFDNTYSAEKRILLWTVGYEIAKTRPLFGSGLNSIAQSYKNFDYQHYFYFQNRSFGPPRLQSLVITSSHNLFLDQLIQGGVVQLIFFTILLTVTFFHLPTPATKISFLLWLSWMQFQLPAIAHWLILSFFIGISTQSLTTYSRLTDNDSNVPKSKL